MKRPLSRAFDPPAPMVPALIRAPGGLDTMTLEGKLDTGADLSAVPERCIVQLDLPPVRTVRAATFTGELQEVILYRADIELGDMTFPRVEVLSTRRPYAILGRNLLRHLVMRVDGPGERLEVRRPPRGRAPSSRGRAGAA